MTAPEHCADILQRLGEILSANKQDSAEILPAVEHLINKNTSSKDTIQEYEQRYNAVHSQLNQLQRDNFELRKALNKARLSSEPAIVQVKQLLLDPAMNKEFASLKKELESSQAEIRRLQGELDGLTFTQQSNAGRKLMAKCKKLTEENEEMGHEISEGRIHELETQLSTSRKYGEQLRQKYKELETHCFILDEEAEDTKQQLFMAKSQQEERSSSKYRERSTTPRRMSPDFREPTEMYERRRVSHSMERKRRLSEERGAPVPIPPPRDRSAGISAHEDDREYLRRRYK